MSTPDTAVAAAQEMIAGITNLPQPPPVFTQIIQVVNDSETSAQDVAAIVAKDPSIASKVVKITNSVHYGLSEPVTSVKQAIVIIGLNGVKSLVVSASIIDMFKGDRVPQDFQDRFWRHSLVTAFASRMLMREVRADDFGAGELAFSTGLLHDIGKMIMYLHSPSDAQRLLTLTRDGDADELDTERSLFGIDHAVIGGVLTETWKMPAVLSHAIANHHQPLAFDDPLRLTDVVHVADGLAYHALAAGAESLSAPPIEPGVFERNDLKLEELGEYLARLKKEYVQAEAFLKLARGDG